MHVTIRVAPCHQLSSGIEANCINGDDNDDYEEADREASEVRYRGALSRSGRGADGE